MKKSITLSLFFILFSFSIFAQDNIFEGKIFDGVEKTSLPFSHVTILNSLDGTTSNEDGEFSIHYEQGDTLVLSYMGYKDEMIIPTPDNSGKIFNLFPNINELPEIIVRPFTIKEVLKNAYENYTTNIPQTPFAARSYFSGLSTATRKNKSNIIKHEAVFLSNFPILSNTDEKTKHRLVLYDSIEIDNGANFSFVTENKKLKKRMEEEEEKKKEEEESERDEETDDVTNNSPNSMLKTFEELIELPFLDTLTFEFYDYKFEKSTTYQGEEVIVISFKSDVGKLALKSYEGKIFINQENYAIVSLDYVEKVRVPVILKPIISMKLGFKVKGIRMYHTINFQRYKNNWYPKNIIEKQNITAYKTAVFIKTKKVDFSMKRVLNIDQIQLSENHPILEAENFDGKKEYLTQIYNHENIKWSDINRIDF